jgi:hypothetical protein
MKKLLFIAVLMLTLIGVSGCEEKQPTTDLNMEAATVATNVKGWTVYTNPAYRWEIRVPKSWSYTDSGETGYQATFYAKPGNPTVEIMSKSNWQENYTLEDFYKNQTVNIWANYKSEDMTLGGNPVKLFRDVKGLVQGSPDATAQVMAMSIGDRIVEIRMYEVTDESKTLVNSIKFYGNAGKVIE